MRTIEEADVEHQHVLVRADLNVPLQDGRIADDFRIRAALPTIRELIERGAKVIVCSHLGRPGGEPRDDLRLDPVAKRLSELLDRAARKVDDCVGPEVREAADAMQDGDVLVLENTRFHAGEKENDDSFAGELASVADLFVNDAFATAHRAHASTVGVTRHLPSYAGELFAREVRTLARARDEPRHPYVAVLGGAKVSDKIGVVKHLLDEVDVLLVGGGVANTFLRARRQAIGESLYEEDALAVAATILDEPGDKLVLPVDVIVAEELSDDAFTKTVPVAEVPPRWKILDIGPQTLEMFGERLQEAEQVVWSGPLGAFEKKPFRQGSIGFARALAALDAVTITGGGETVLAVHEAGVADELTHVSTGGGAFLKFMEGKSLPALEALAEDPQHD